MTEWPWAMVVRQPDPPVVGPGHLPTGTIMERRWLELGPYKDCLIDPTGAVLTRDDFPELYAVMGRAYSRDDDPEGAFRVPDLRGRILTDDSADEPETM